MPSVSVVMAVRNAARHLALAIDSVLAQSMADFELVVVDDGSTDDSRAIVAARGDRRIVVVDNPCPLSGYGAARALNLGIARARSDVIARMDGDDVAHPSRLERQLALLVARPDVVMVGAQGRVIDAAGRVVRPLNRPLSPTAIRWTQLIDNPFVHSVVMFRRKAVVDVGGYDEASLWMEDWDLWSRLLAGHPVLNLPDRLVDYRDHPGTATRVRDPERSRAVAGRIIARSAATVIGRQLDVNEARLLAGFGLGLERHEVRSFVTLLVRLAREFRRRDPDAARAAEPTRTLAGQLDAAAARVRPSSRAAALAVYCAGIAASPGVARWLPWSRVWARLIVGPSSVHRLGRGGWRCPE